MEHDPEQELREYEPFALLDAALWECMRDVEAVERLKQGGSNPFYFRLRDRLVEALGDLGHRQLLSLDREVALAFHVSHEDGYETVPAIAHVNPDGVVIGFVIKRGDQDEGSEDRTPTS
jgi:hypothetical protein